MKSLNAGEILEHAVRRQNVNISELSRRMKVNRRTLYNWFHQEKLHLDVVCAIGQVINYDFSKEFQDEFIRSGVKLVTEDINQQPVQQIHTQESIYYWMNKYITLLEDYKALLESSRGVNESLSHCINELTK